MAKPKYPLIVICGPTAVGKTQLAIDIAKLFNGEIVSADSRQFFREMSIGTAKPTIEEMDGIVHHFVNNLSIAEDYTAGKFETDALECIEAIHLKGKTPILVGGSGLYIKAVIEGLDPLPANDSLRISLNELFESQGLSPLQGRLKSLDPEYYTQVDQLNHIRLIRAIEVIETTGQIMATLQKGRQKERDFSPIVIGLETEREVLYHRINLRVDMMVSDGLVSEVKVLMPFRDKQALQTVGYREFFPYFDHKTDLITAVDLVKRNTRRYAKRQLTWLRSMPNIVWFDPRKPGDIIDFIERKSIELRG